MRRYQMDNPRLTRILAVVAVMLTAAVVAAPARAAAPRYILVSGPGLQRPVLLGNWSENLSFLIGSLPGKRPKPGWRAGRPRYDLALFWGVLAKPVPTDPGKASQHGWFYPAVGSRRAVVKLLISGRTSHVLQRDRRSGSSPVTAFRRGSSNGRTQSRLGRHSGHLRTCRSVTGVGPTCGSWC
jgi:hypothetical protein